MLHSLNGSAPVANSRPVRTRDYSVEVQRSGPAVLPPIHHNLHLVTVVLSGEPVVIRGGPDDGCALRLAAGDSSLRPSGPGRQVTWPEGIHCLHVHLHPRLLRRLAGSDTAGLQMRPRLRDPVVRDIAVQLYRLVRPGARPDTGAAADLVMALAHHVASVYPAPETPLVRVGSRSLEQVLDLFREQATSSLSVDRIAASCGLSRPHFSRRIRALTGLWPRTMILGSRLEAAKHLLERDEAPLGRVACAAGFADQSHLTRALRHGTGLTPALYRASRAFKTSDGTSVG
jgi:AraC family transcriptional regulator